MLPYYTDRARESSSSEGTGDFTLEGASPGYQTFSDGGAEGETVDYAIEAVNSDGIPTGQWETGKGAYSAGVLTRTTPEQGSEALPVDFAAGSKNVFITVTAVTFASLGSKVHRYDESGNYQYVGDGAPGTAEGAAAWTIYRLTYASGAYVETKSATNVTWTGRAGHTYT